jgi:hypothetical protein
MSFYLAFPLVFMATFLADVCWTKYMIHVNKHNPLAAANWSTAIIFMGAFTVISYNTNHWLIIAAGLGSWAGTYLTVRRERNKVNPTVPQFLTETQEMV